MAPISTTGGRALQLPQCIPLRVTSHPLIPNRSDYSACLVHLSDTTLYDFDKRHASKPIAVSIPDTGNRTDAARGVLFSSSSSSSCSSCSSSYLFTPTEAPINGTTQGWLTVSDFTIVSMRCYGVKSFATSASFPVTYISATQSVQPDFNEEERFGQAEVAPLLKDMQTLVRMLLGLRDWEKLRQRATRAHTQADRGSQSAGSEE
ncbi:hypothetical protein BD289DRAFT_509662 [Coniella lustricola]|uniref:Uncharacterized protein n=1 Tax=Coniella lustricola TaxID=2025994 RepID=A0A2T2ZTY2_9PEZI|nr:hypothetical protein BD289DRAFT_509662 [Coniella lustricola]